MKSEMSEAILDPVQKFMTCDQLNINTTNNECTSNNKALGSHEEGRNVRLQSVHQTGGKTISCFNVFAHMKNELSSSHVDSSDGKLRNQENQKSQSGKDPVTKEPEIRLYKKRFLMLFLFSMCSLLNSMQNFQYSIIADITCCYYDVSVFAVNWTMLVYMVVYIAAVFPVSWMIDRMGLRLTLLLGALGNALSTGIQCASLTADSFSMVLLAQSVSALSQLFILATPPYIAAVWFGPDEVSRACAAGVFANQFGAALGFIFTPMIVSNDCKDKSAIKRGFGIVAYSLVAANIIFFVLIVIFFENKPPKPPSLAELKKSEGNTQYTKTILRLIRNWNFILLFISYGLVIGVYFATGTILNELIVRKFPGKEEDIGWMGLILVVAGLVASVIFGCILDKTHKYKETSVAIAVLSFCSMVAFTGFMEIPHLWLQFITITVLGFFMTGYLPVGFDFGSEITYPEPEAITASLLNTSTMFFGIVLTMFGSWMLENHGDLAPNLLFCAVFLIASIITAFIKPELRRREQYLKQSEKEFQC